MKNFYCCSARCLATLLLLAPAGAALAQAPVITGIVPLANARTVSRTSPVTVSFSQNLTPASAGALKVFSSQRGGLRSRGATPAVVSGNALNFAPTAYSWMPGETVQYTVTAAVGSGGRGGVIQARVGKFTIAAGAAGRGNFSLGPDASVTFQPADVVTGDVDGDGDLDLLTTASNNAVSVRLRAVPRLVYTF